MSRATDLLTNGNALRDEDHIEITHVEFASSVLDNRRNAINLSVEHILQMASAILVLDHQRQELETRLITMLAEPPGEGLAERSEPQRVVKPEIQTQRIVETQYMPIVGAIENQLNPLLRDVVKAYQYHEQQKFGSYEAGAVRKLHKSAQALGRFLTEIENKRKQS